MDDPAVRTVCGVIALDHVGQVLLIRRADDGTWGLPGGGVEPGEDCDRPIAERGNAATDSQLVQGGCDRRLDVGSAQQTAAGTVPTKMAGHPAAAPSRDPAQRPTAWPSAPGLRRVGRSGRRRRSSSGGLSGSPLGGLVLRCGPRHGLLRERYHRGIWTPAARRRLKVLDHTAIFGFTAASYIPLALALPRAGPAARRATPPARHSLVRSRSGQCPEGGPAGRRGRAC